MYMFFIIIICFLKGIFILNVCEVELSSEKGYNQILKCGPGKILRHRLQLIEDITGMANHQKAKVTFGISIDCPSNQLLASLSHWITVKVFDLEQR